MRIIDADALKKLIMPLELSMTNKRSIITIIDSLPTTKPCENCDLYFKAMTKEVQKNDV